MRDNGHSSTSASNDGSVVSAPASDLPPARADDEDDGVERRPRRRRSLVASDARAWLTFAGCVLIVAVLRWAEAVFIPLALALLLTFLLNVPVTYLQRWVRRSIAAGAVVSMTLLAVVLVGWVLAYQVTSLAEGLPAYRQNIRQKVADIRGAGESRWLLRLQSTLDDIQAEMRRGRPASETRPTPVVVAGDAVSSWGLPRWTGTLMAPLGMMAVVFVLVTFMLAEYSALRDRLLAVVGYGYLANTTRAFDEAATRLSRYLAMQLLINTTYGALVVIGLWLIGVPYPMLWGVLGALLRFVPYVGPWIGASAPVLMSLAVFPGWYETLWTVGLMVALELFTNLVLETLLYAGAAGVSQVALLVAIGFWTWLWGPVGLLLGMPITVCLVVMAKHIPALSVFQVLMTDRPALSPDQAYYQRVLAGHTVEASALVREFLKTHPAEEIYDAVLLPALNYARRDRRDRRISAEAEAEIADVTRELLIELAAQPSDADGSDSEPARDATDQPKRLLVMGYPAHGTTGDAALRMLASLCEGLPIQVDVAPARTLVSELVNNVSTGGHQVVCIADLPPHSLSKVRYALTRLRQSCPEVKVLVGRWASEGLSPDVRLQLMEAGAIEVASTLISTRNQLRGLVVSAPNGESEHVRGAA
jgi:predicted PurR-regulated permease PerM